MRCVCGLPRPLNPPIVGIQYGLDDTPALILWNCACKSTRAIRWDDAAEAERRDAINVELSRNGRSEMMMGAK